MNTGSVRFTTIEGARGPAPESALKACRPYRLALLLKNLVNPAYRTARKAADDAAARYGIEVSHFWPRKPDDLAEQSALLASIVDAGDYDGLVFTPADPAAQVPLLERANAAGLPLYNISNIVEGGEIVAFVGCDDVAIGRALITWLAHESGGEARILLIEGAQAPPTARMRLQGVQEALSRHPGLRLQGSACANFDRRQAAEATAVLLGEHPDADTVVALNDEMALGAIGTLEAVGRLDAFRVLGVNGTPEGLQAIEAGSLAATVDYALYSITRRAIEFAVRHLNGERIDEQVVLLPTKVYDRTNVNEAIAERLSWGVM